GHCSLSLSFARASVPLVCATDCWTDLFTDKASSAVSAESPAGGWLKERTEVRELCTNQPTAAPSTRPMKRPTNSSVIGSAELMYSLSHTRQTTLTIAVAWIE